MHATLYDPARPSSLSPLRDFCVGFESLNTLATGFLYLIEAQSLQGFRAPLRPAYLPVYASQELFDITIGPCLPPQIRLSSRCGCFPPIAFRFSTPPFVPVSFSCATLGKDDWLGLVLRGLSPRMECQACLGALSADKWFKSPWQVRGSWNANSGATGRVNPRVSTQRWPLAVLPSN